MIAGTDATENLQEEQHGMYVHVIGSAIHIEVSHTVCDLYARMEAEEWKKWNERC